MSKIQKSEVLRIIWAAVGGAALFASISIANTFQEQHIGASLKYQTTSAHKDEVLRKLLIELEKMVWDKHEVLYLRIMDKVDSIMTFYYAIQQRPKTIDPFFACDVTNTYDQLFEVCEPRLTHAIDKTGAQDQLKDVKALLAQINQIMFTCLKKTLFACKSYRHVDIRFRKEIPNYQDRDTPQEEEEKKKTSL